MTIPLSSSRLASHTSIVSGGSWLLEGVIFLLRTPLGNVNQARFDEFEPVEEPLDLGERPDIHRVAASSIQIPSSLYLILRQIVVRRVRNRDVTARRQCVAQNANAAASNIR